MTLNKVKVTETSDDLEQRLITEVASTQEKNEANKERKR